MDHKYANEEAYCENANIEAYNKKFKPVKQSISVVKDNDKKEIVYWELANGKKIDIDLMTIEHLKNTLKLIVKRGLLKDK